jgi:AbrB family looped-hinge helix DNA binding protein
MNSTATVRERGQVTIPKDVRDKAQLGEGVVVEFEVSAEGIFMRPKIVVDGLDLDEAFVLEIITSTREGFEEISRSPEAARELRLEQELLEGASSDALEE